MVSLEIHSAHRFKYTGRAIQKYMLYIWGNSDGSVATGHRKGLQQSSSPSILEMRQFDDVDADDIDDSCNFGVVRMMTI